MNGAHDLGGMDGFGPIEVEENEPIFHAEWERRMFAIASSVPFTVPFGDDHFRREIERIPPSLYLNYSYYELWFHAIRSLLIEYQAITPEDFLHATQNLPRPVSPDAVRAGKVEEAILRGVSTREELAEVTIEYKVGDDVRVRNNHPFHHTRAPRYARGRVGRIVKDHGIFGFPDSNSQNLGTRSQHCYAVEFSGAELWGNDAEAGTMVVIDLWTEYLEPVTTLKSH